MRTRIVVVRHYAPAAVAIAVLLVVILAIPLILVKGSGTSNNPPQSEVVLSSAPDVLSVPVFLTKEQRIEQVPLETYVRNVLAAEMPAEFELEALKAQAIASRTYIVKRWLDQDRSNVPVQEALVTDTVSHQAYLSEEQMNREWGTKSQAARLDKLNRAVIETAGLIITYAKKPIQAVFFSTSNGHTENSEEYWRDFIPYLRSVPSPWDEKLSPRYKSTTRMTVQQMAQKLGIQNTQAITRNGGLRVTERTTGNRIKTITIAGHAFSGREIREKLGLDSSQFIWRIDGSAIEFTTYGYGHGVGMSQWGANGMAKEGKTAEAIIKYYYKGVEVERVENLLKTGA